jgi:hypothetical protein
MGYAVGHANNIVEEISIKTQKQSTIFKHIAITIGSAVLPMLSIEIH